MNPSELSLVFITQICSLGHYWKTKPPLCLYKSSWGYKFCSYSVVFNKYANLRQSFCWFFLLSTVKAALTNFEQELEAAGATVYCCKHIKKEGRKIGEIGMKVDSKFT